MGKVITVPAAAEFKLGKGDQQLGFKTTFFDLMIDAMDTHGPVDDLGHILAAGKLVKKLEDARDASAATLAVEDAELKVLQDVSKKLIKTKNPKAARNYAVFLLAIQEDKVQDVELPSKK